MNINEINKFHNSKEKLFTDIVTSLKKENQENLVEILARYMYIWECLIRRFVLNCVKKRAPSSLCQDTTSHRSSAKAERTEKR